MLYAVNSSYAALNLRPRYSLTDTVITAAFKTMSFRSQLADFRAAAGYDDPKTNKENDGAETSAEQAKKKPGPSKRTKLGVRRRLLSRIGPAVAQVPPCTHPPIPAVGRP